MSPHCKKKSSVRGFERDLRIRELIAAEVIKDPTEVPADAIPASPPVGRRVLHAPFLYRLAKQTMFA